MAVLPIFLSLDAAHVTNLDPMNRGLKRGQQRVPALLYKLVTNLDPMNRGLKRAKMTEAKEVKMGYKPRPDE